MYYCLTISGIYYVLQVVRDIWLVVPDIVAVIITMAEMIKLAKRKNTPLSKLFYKEELMFCVLATTFFVMISHLL